MARSTKIPSDYVALVLATIDHATPEFELIEVGCGDGRILRRLAKEFPRAHFTGIDLQISAVELGNKYLSTSSEPEARVELICGSCLDDGFGLSCDYLISRTALIYLDDEEIKTFLSRLLPKLRRRAIFQELVSTTGKTERSHFFAHPLSALIEEIAPGRFEIRQYDIAYAPWKGWNWTGASLIVTRKREASLPNELGPFSSLESAKTQSD